MALVTKDEQAERALFDYEVLLLLDHTPASVEALARATGRPPDVITNVLERAEADGLAVDWGDVWATTWRAKLKLEPDFFRLWIPSSLAAGAAVTVLALALNGPASADALLPWFAGVATISVLWSLVEVVRGG